jgi:hypothetical protein
MRSWFVQSDPVMDPWTSQKSTSTTYMVSDCPLLQSQGVSLSMQSSLHGGDDEEKDLKKGSSKDQSVPPPAPRSARVPTPLPKVTSRMVMQYSGGDETVLQAGSMVMKAHERFYEKCPAFFSFILSTMTAPSRAVVQEHPDFLEAHTSSDEDCKKDALVQSRS